MEDFVMNLVSNIGVPTAISFYLLLKVNHTLNELVKSVNDLTFRLAQKERG